LNEFNTTIFKLIVNMLEGKEPVIPVNGLPLFKKWF